MENIAEALKRAGAVLLFVLALSIIIVSFGQVRQSVDIIIDYKDRETFYIETSYYYESIGNERTVSFETIIPSVFRAYLENYQIVFDGITKPIYKIKKNDGTTVSKYSLDLEVEKLASGDEQKGEFLSGILYHDFSISGNQINFEKKFNNISLDDCESIYDQLSGKTITESLGVYYQDDSENEPNVNKVKKRVITYKVK